MRGNNKTQILHFNNSPSGKLLGPHSLQSSQELRDLLVCLTGLSQGYRKSLWVEGLVGGRLYLPRPGLPRNPLKEQLIGLGAPHKTSPPTQNYYNVSNPGQAPNFPFLLFQTASPGSLDRSH